MKATKKLPDQSYLRECFDYDPDSGLCAWRERPMSHFRSSGRQSQEWICRRWNSRMAGKPVGYLSVSAGYWVGRIDGRRYWLHRLIWKWMTGEEPREVDHISGVRAVNVWANLRNSTREQNARNKRKTRGQYPKGVYRDKRRGTYTMQIRIPGGKRIRRSFKTAESAYAAYCAAAREQHGEFWCAG